MHKIRSLENSQKKISRQKFWSHGTTLGYLRPGSQGDLGLGFCGPQFLLVWGPYKPPALVAPEGTAKNLKPTAAWCDVTHSWGSCFLMVGHNKDIFKT